MVTQSPERVRYPETSIGLTWGQLVVLEPRLRDLARDARRQTDLCSLCRFFGHRQRGYGVKAAMEQLVGWFAKHPDANIRSSRAYDVAFQYLYYRCIPAQHEPCSYCGGVG